MKLLINEFVKDYKKKTTWLYLILLFGIVFLYEYIIYKNTGVDGFDLNSSIANLSDLPAGIATILILIMFANNLSQEYSRGTIKFLYSKPKSRSAILTAKVVLALFNFVAFTCLGTAFTYVVKRVFYPGKINLSNLNANLGAEYFNRTVLEQFTISTLLNVVIAIFYISMVLLVCVIFKTQILSLVLVMFSLIGGSIIQNLTLLVVNKFSWVKYHLFDAPLLGTYYTSETGRNLVVDMFKFKNGYELLGMLLAYTVVFFIISYIVNARRDITLD